MKMHDDFMTWKCIPHYWHFVRVIHHSHMDFTQRAISAEFWYFRRCLYLFHKGLQCLCLPCVTIWQVTTFREQMRLNVCLGYSKMAHRMFRHLHGCHGHCKVFSVFKTVAQRSTWRLVAHQSLKWGRREAHALLWLQNGCTMVSKWLQPCAKGGFSWTNFWTNKWVVGYLRLYEAHVMSL